jgi:thiopurine S-methyltransferase
MGFWEERWAENKIGFHEGEPNSFLVKHHDVLAGAPRVLVPLCGKAEDLSWLAARGHAVVGVELVEDAVKAFFAEHALHPVVTQRGPLVEYEAGGITIYAGDIFATTTETLGQFDAIYDRAALVALPPDLRPRYAEQVRSLCLAGGRILQICFEYPEGHRQGPPFSVSEYELRHLYPGARITLLETRPDYRDPTDDKLSDRCYSLAL